MGTPTTNQGKAHTLAFQQYHQNKMTRADMRAPCMKSIIKGTKMDLPRFEGTCHLGWSNNATSIFQMSAILEEYKMFPTHLYITGKAGV